MRVLQFSTTTTTSFGFVGSPLEEQHVSTLAQWVKVIPAAALSQSQTRAIKRLIAIRDLPHNWDSYGSPPPSESAIDAAIQLLIGIDLDELASPRIVPVSGGGVQLEWEVGARELELEIINDGSIRYLKVERGEPIEESEVALSNRVQIGFLLTWLISETSVERAA